jgi:hypothetical protein
VPSTLKKFKVVSLMLAQRGFLGFGPSDSTMESALPSVKLRVPGWKWAEMRKVYLTVKVGPGIRPT